MKSLLQAMFLLVLVTGVAQAGESTKSAKQADQKELQTPSTIQPETQSIVSIDDIPDVGMQAPDDAPDLYEEATDPLDD